MAAAAAAAAVDGTGAAELRIAACLSKLAAIDELLKAARLSLASSASPRADDLPGASCIDDRLDASAYAPPALPAAAFVGRGHLSRITEHSQRICRPVPLPHLSSFVSKRVVGGTPSVLVDRAVAEGLGCSPGASLRQQRPSSLDRCLDGKGYVAAPLIFANMCRGRCRFPVFQPDSAWLLAWNSCGILSITYLFFSMPVELSFGRTTSTALDVLAYAMDVYFVLDVLVNFMTGYFDEGIKGTLVMEPCLIARKYMRGWFLLDVFAGFPWDLVTSNGKYQGLKSLLFVRVARITKISRLLRLMRSNRVKEMVDIATEEYPSFRFCTAVLYILVLLCGITHWAACAWYAVGSLPGYKTSWLDLHIEDHAGTLDRYIISVYFTLTTMTTVGYGDISPQNFAEVCFVLVLLLVATVVFASLMGALTSVVSSMKSEDNAVAERKRVLGEYLRRRRIPNKLRASIRNHLKFLWQKGGEFPTYEKELREQLPPALGQVLSYHIFGGWLLKAPFLAWISDYELCLKELSAKLSSRFLAEGDFVFRVGSPNAEVIMLCEGRVRISLNESLHDPMAGFSEDERSDSAALRMTLAVMQQSVVDQDEDEVPKLQKGGSGALGAGSRDPSLVAGRKLRERECREHLAARLIQRNWRDRQSSGAGHSSLHQTNPIGRRVRSRKASRIETMDSRSVGAPAYFGESCLWQDMEEWGSGQCPQFTYSARCASRVEIIVMPRGGVKEVIDLFSPWLRDRFLYFRRALLEELGVEDGASKEVAGSVVVSPARWINPGGLQTLDSPLLPEAARLRLQKRRFHSWSGQGPRGGGGGGVPSTSPQGDLSAPLLMRSVGEP